MIPTPQFEMYMYIFCTCCGVRKSWIINYSFEAEDVLVQSTFVWSVAFIKPSCADDLYVPRTCMVTDVAIRDSHRIYYKWTTHEGVQIIVHKCKQAVHMIFMIHGHAWSQMQSSVTVTDLLKNIKNVWSYIWNGNY